MLQPGNSLSVPVPASITTGAYALSLLVYLIMQRTLFLISVFICLSITAAYPLNWTITEIDPDKKAADAPLAFDLDRHGKPYVVYADEKRHALLVGKKSGDRWEKRRIYDMAGLGAKTAVALDMEIDQHNKIFIAHCGWRAYQGAHLDYISNKLGGWSVSQVSARQKIGLDARIRLDKAGRPNIACRGTKPGSDILFFTRLAREWRQQKQGSKQRLGFCIDLEMGQEYRSTVPDFTASSLGKGRAEAGTTRRYRPFIAHARYPASGDKYSSAPIEVHLRHVSPKGIWEDEIIPASGTVGLGLAMEISRWDEPHMCFGGDNRLLYAARISGGSRGQLSDWQVQTLLAGPPLPVSMKQDLKHASEFYAYFTDLALTDENEPLIIYTAPGGLFFTHRENDKWTHEPIAEGKGVGRWARMKLDGWGGVQVVYYNPANEKIYHAYGRP
jgi:hypothetical protein